MSRSKKLLLAAALAIVPALGGCDDIDGPKAIVTAATRPANVATKPVAAVIAPSTLPTSRPALAYLTVNGEIREFPRARAVIRYQRNAGGLVLQLFSDDPKDAINDNYDGNGFYFDVDLKTADPQLVDGTVWTCRASTMQRLHTKIGLFLDGTRYHLQPREVELQINQLGPTTLSATFAGPSSFLMFDTRDKESPGQLVFVAGTLTAEIEKR